MNDLEIQCLAFVKEALTNRPKDYCGHTVSYNEKDREILLDIISEQKESIEQNKSTLSKECYELLMYLYQSLYELVQDKKI